MLNHHIINESLLYYSFRKNNNQSVTILEVHVKDQGAGSIYIGLMGSELRFKRSNIL